MSEIATRAAALVGGTLVAARRLSGGSLSEVVRLRLADGRELVAKHGITARAEAEMLRAIGATGATAPEVVGVADDLLVMTAAASDNPLGAGAWASLVEVLGRLHVPSGEPYGWPVDHAFGAVAILNARSDDWATFWADRRLRCHLPYIGTDLGRRIERLADRLSDLLPARPASVLLHGDLWGGNVMVNRESVTLIDPACYYGHREVDVAMLTLFDHPPQRFFDALGLDPGWRERLPLYRLWPLLVHLRLFGSGYRAQVCDTLDRAGA